MNFVKFFSAESKLTDLRLHTYFIWVWAQFQRWNLGIVSTSRRADETYPLFADTQCNVCATPILPAIRATYTLPQFYHLKNF